MAEIDYFTIGLLGASWVLLKIWSGLGGWPEAWWRIRRIRYFVAFFIEEDRQVSRYPLKWKRIIHKSPARFTTKLGDYLTGGAKETFTSRGRPAWLYNWDDTRPLPVYDREVLKIPPTLITEGFANDAIERTHRLRGQKVKMQILLVFLVFMALLVGMLAAYYSYNTACALNSPVCIRT